MLRSYVRWTRKDRKEPRPTPTWRGSAPHRGGTSLGCYIRCSITLKTLCLFWMNAVDYSPAARFRLLNRIIMMENPHADDTHDQLIRSNRTALQPRKRRSVCINRESFQGWTAMLSTCTPRQWDQTDTMYQMRYQLRVTGVWRRWYDPDMKQELAACKVATENVSRPGVRPHWEAEATGRPSNVEESCQDHEGYLTFFGSCRACLFINVSSL